MKAEIIISKEKLAHITELREMTTKDILEKYEYKREGAQGMSSGELQPLESKRVRTLSREDWCPATGGGSEEEASQELCQGQGDQPCLVLLMEHIR